jgi:hypothetical protein
MLGLISPALGTSAWMPSGLSAALGRNSKLCSRIPKILQRLKMETCPMPNDLTTSPVDRQNILNNPYAVAEIEKAVGIRGIPFEGRSVVLKEQVAAFFEVDARTIDNYLARFDAELRHNGYEVVRGKHLKELKIAPHGLIAAQNNEFFKERGCKSVRCRGFGGRSPLMKKAESQAPTGRINPFGFRAEPGL